MLRTGILAVGGVLLVFLVLTRLLHIEQRLRTKADLEDDVFFILALTALLLTLVLLPTCVLPVD